MYKKRTAIVTGAEEAPEREDEEEEDEEEEEEDTGDDAKGIPEFWLCVLRNHEVTEEQVGCRLSFDVDAGQIACCTEAPKWACL